MMRAETRKVRRFDFRDSVGDEIFAKTSADATLRDKDESFPVFHFFITMSSGKMKDRQLTKIITQIGVEKFHFSIMRTIIYLEVSIREYVPQWTITSHTLSCRLLIHFIFKMNTTDFR